MNNVDQDKALTELDEQLYVIHKPIHDPFGYYRENAHGYTMLCEAWRVTKEVGERYIGGKPTDYDRVVIEPAPVKSYRHSYDAILPLVKKCWQSHLTASGTKWQLRFYTSLPDSESILLNTPEQLCEALLRAAEKWIE